MPRVTVLRCWAEGGGIVSGLSVRECMALRFSCSGVFEH